MSLYCPQIAPVCGTNIAKQASLIGRHFGEVCIHIISATSGTLGS